MDEDEQQFLRAIAADPGDDTLRLVFADWLDDHDRHREADYLRKIRHKTFVRRVNGAGGNLMAVTGGRLTIPEVAQRFTEYLRNHGAWGDMHIVLDDGNVGDSSVMYCLKNSHDPEAIVLCSWLLYMTPTQRLKLPHICWAILNWRPTGHYYFPVPESEVEARCKSYAAFIGRYRFLTRRPAHA